MEILWMEDDDDLRKTEAPATGNCSIHGNNVGRTVRRRESGARPIQEGVIRKTWISSEVQVLFWITCCCGYPQAIMNSGVDESGE
mmetsp:Transcript_32035/g.59185  ORF Transcript_32035/g.59185 Transcript_32035/m.59185 type:complete len:85 (-) Transcript_32035:44-298(-)